MKTPKAAPKLERNALSTPSMKIRKNKKAGFQGKLDSKKAKLALDKSNPNVNVVDVKSVPKNSSPNSRPNAQVNGKTVAKSAPTSPVSANVGKNKKPNKVSPNATPQSGPQGKRKSKKGKEARSPEVQLGLKIEKLLESPKGGKQPGGGGGKKKKQKGATPGGPAQDGKPQAQPSSPGKGKKRKRNNKEKPDSPSAAVQNGSADPQGKQKPKQKPNKGKAPRIDEDAPISIGDFPNRSSIEGAVKSLLKEVEQRKQKTPALLGDSEPIHVVVTFFKAYSGGRRLQRILLPHTPHGADPDVIFFAPDMKKAKNDPEESIEYYTDLFREHGVTGISEIIPYRKVTKEYTQYEEKRKLINRSDVMLIDSRISHRWASIMRKSTARKKAPIPVRTLVVSNMKKNFDAAMKKTTVLCKDNSLELNLIVGQTTTKAPQLADNIATVASAFCDLQRFPGGQPNIRKIVVKTAKSDSFPVFVSTVSPNAVAKPKAPKKKKAEVVTGEVTSAGVTVAVHPDGKIKIKSKDVDLNETEHDTSPQKKRAAEKRKDVDSEDEDDDDESVMDEEESGDEDSDEDDVDPTTVKKFKLANKASDDETTDEEEIERAEQEFLLALRKQQNALEAEAKAANTKAKKEASKSGKPVAEEFDDDDDESDEEDIESDDDEDSDESDVPDLIPAKKPQSVQPQKGKGKPQGGKPKGSNGPAAGQKGKNQWQRKGGKGNSPQQKGGKGGSPQQKGKQGKPFQKGNKKPNNQQGSPKARYFNMKAGGKKK